MAFKSALSKAKSLFTPPSVKPSRVQPPRGARKKPEKDFIYPVDLCPSFELGTTLTESQLQSVHCEVVIPESQSPLQGNDSLQLSSSISQIPDSQIPESLETPKSCHGDKMRSAVLRTLSLPDMSFGTTDLLSTQYSTYSSDAFKNSKSQRSLDDFQPTGVLCDLRGASTLKTCDVKQSTPASIQTSSSPLSQVIQAPLPSLSQTMADLSPLQPCPQQKITELQGELMQTKITLDKMSKTLLDKNDTLTGLHAQLTMFQEAEKQYIKAKSKHEHDLAELVSDNNVISKLNIELKIENTDIIAECNALKKDKESLKNELNSISIELEKHVNLQSTKEYEVVYFRGFSDPLSAFFGYELKPNHGIGSGLSFRSAEHLYHFRRMIAHDEVSIADRVRKAYTAAKAKSISEKAVPPQDSSTAWLDKAMDEMIDINLIKAEQCTVFRKTLLETGTARLVHNMESDEQWGFGKHGNGLNWMGKALESVRQHITSSLNASATPFHSEYQDSVISASSIDNIPHLGSNQKQSVLVLSDSMLKDAEKFFQQDRFNIDLQVYSGATFNDLTNKVRSAVEAKKPDVVIIHCGTNCVIKENKDQAARGLQALLKVLKWHCVSNILLSGVVHRLDNTLHNSKIDCLNDLMKSHESENIFFVEHNATFRHLRNVLNKDGVHLKDGGKRQVIKNLEIVLRTGGSKNPEVRKWVPKAKSESNVSKVYQISYDKPKVRHHKQGNSFNSGETKLGYAQNQVRSRPHGRTSAGRLNVSKRVLKNKTSFRKNSLTPHYMSDQPPYYSHSSNHLTDHETSHFSTPRYERGQSTYYIHDDNHMTDHWRSEFSNPCYQSGQSPYYSYDTNQVTDQSQFSTPPYVSGQSPDYLHDSNQINDPWRSEYSTSCYENGQSPYYSHDTNQMTDHWRSQFPIQSGQSPYYLHSSDQMSDHRTSQFQTQPMYEQTLPMSSAMSYPPWPTLHMGFQVARPWGYH